MEHEIHDIAIIGAGPCGLAVAARMREPVPSALFTDHEHARYWNRYHHKITIEKEKKRSRFSCPEKKDCVGNTPSIVVLDADSDQWMSSWRSKFQKLAISHLRSPLFFHPDPRDRDGLLAFVHAEERINEICEIPNVVGREMTKHHQKKARKLKNASSMSSSRHLNLDNQDRNDYHTPTSCLFDSYIDSIIQRYSLQNIVKHAEITDVDYDFIDTSVSKFFTLKTSANDTIHARTVVLATGPSTSSSRLLSAHLPLTSSEGKDHISHVFDPNCPCLLSRVKERIEISQKPQIMVVGGGLTSAQVVDLLLTRYERAGLTIHLIFRSKLKVKHFDVDLHWIAKLRNHEMAAFWSADSDEERVEMLRAARGGGSITPAYAKILEKWVQKGRLVMHQGYEIDRGATEPGLELKQQPSNVSNGGTVWNHATRSWTVSLKRSPHAVASRSTSASQQPPRKLIEGLQHILFATSSPPNIHQLSLLTSIKERHPIDDIQGLPILAQDLTWHDDVPLFVTGALAGLRLGPGAGNLGGARLGAERIAWRLEEILGTVDNKGTCVNFNANNSARHTAVEAMSRRMSGGNFDANLWSRSGSTAASKSSGNTTPASDVDTDPGTNSDNDASTFLSSTTSVSSHSKASREAFFDAYMAGSGNQFASIALPDEE